MWEMDYLEVELSDFFETNDEGGQEDRFALMKEATVLAIPGGNSGRRRSLVAAKLELVSGKRSLSLQVMLTAKQARDLAARLHQTVFLSEHGS